MREEVFVYGTLMWPSVLEAVLGRRPDARPAVITGFIRRRVKEQHYPALVHADTPSPPPPLLPLVRGLLLAVDSREVRLLDNYEDDEYRLAPVDATPLDLEAFRIATRLLPPEQQGDPFAWATAKDQVLGKGWEAAARRAGNDGGSTVETTTYLWEAERFGTLLEDGPHSEWDVQTFAPHEETFVGNLRYWLAEQARDRAKLATADEASERDRSSRQLQKAEC